MSSAWGIRWRLMRPFTLGAPALGMISGALAAVGAGRVADADADPQSVLIAICSGSLLAMLLNAASNVLNQVHDLNLDRINKPDRPLPRGEISLQSAQRLSWWLYVAAIALACTLKPQGSWALPVIVLLTSVVTWAYSAPPLRLRNSWWLAPLVIAVPRGLLLKVAGWGSVACVDSDHEPWVLGSIFFLYVLGAAAIKDFEDVAGDQAMGAGSLPIRFGARRAARLMAPFLVLPWLLLALAPHATWNGAPLLRIAPVPAAIAGALLMLCGSLAARALIRMADAPHNPVTARAAWRAMYLEMMAAQVLTASAYWWPQAVS